MRRNKRSVYLSQQPVAKKKFDPMNVDENTKIKNSKMLDEVFSNCVVPKMIRIEG